MKVFAVGTIKIDFNNKVLNSRLWFLFKYFEDAHNCIINNSCDIFENYYNFGLIEEVELIDDYSTGSVKSYQQWWYEARYNKGITEDPQIIKIDIPNSFKNITNWWVG